MHTIKISSVAKTSESTHLSCFFSLLIWIFWKIYFKMPVLSSTPFLSVFSLFIFGIYSVLVFHGVHAGNARPYWVSVTGFQGAGSVGQDAGANGYAGSSLVSPLASSGFNSPLARSTPTSSYRGNPSGAGFGGFGHQPSGSHSAPVAGGQGELPSAAYAAGRG